MVNIVATNTNTTITLASLDRVYVAKDVSVIVPNGYAIRADGGVSAVSVVIDGSVVSLALNAVVMSQSADNVGDHTLVIGETGSVRTLSYSGNSAIYMLGAGSALQNWGEVTGRWGTYVTDFDSGVVENHGVMTGRGQDGLFLNTSQNVRVFNSGVISGGNGVEISESSAYLDNFGTIFATISNGAAVLAATATAAITLRNSGTLSAQATAVFLGSHDDRMTNSGTVLGDILLNGGNDTYRGSGMVDGQVSGGDGDDLIVGGIGDDDVLGGAGADNLRGRDGDDTLIGGGGGDVLRGGVGEDRLTGGNGKDRLFGGQDDDRLIGGKGGDIFIFNRNAGDDSIGDFKLAADRIDLTAFGLRPADFADTVAPALSNAGGGATLLDLAQLGGQGSVLIEGLAFADADLSDFIL